MLSQFKFVAHTSTYTVSEAKSYWTEEHRRKAIPIQLEKEGQC